MDAISKLNYILVHQLMSYLNASKEIIIQKTWGYKNQTTGLYSGMAGDLQTGVANLGGKLLEYLWTLSNRVAFRHTFIFHN